MRKRVGRRVTEDEMTKEEALRLWKEARPVEVERVRAESSILSVRLPRRTLQELVLRAREEGKGPATFARELIEEGLTRTERAPLALLLEHLAQRLWELQRQAPSVRFSEAPLGSVTQPGRSTLLTYSLLARTAAPLGQSGTRPAEEGTKVKVRVM